MKFMAIGCVVCWPYGGNGGRVCVMLCCVVVCCVVLCYVAWERMKKE